MQKFTILLDSKFLPIPIADQILFAFFLRQFLEVNLIIGAVLGPGKGSNQYQELPTLHRIGDYRLTLHWLARHVPPGD